jgi:tetratricopeptide (TPR) repeat protein
MGRLLMRKINGKLFLALLLGTTVLAGSVFGVHQFQYQRIARALLWQARHAEEQGQVDRQALYLSRYLEFNPRDDAEKTHLATVWAGDAFVNTPRLRGRAVRLLDEVLTHDGSRADLRRLLVKTALEVGSLKLARGHLEKLLPWDQIRKQKADDGVVDRERGELEGYWGQLLEAEGKSAEAMTCCRLAVRHDPENQASYVRLAYLLRRQKETDPAQREANGREADGLIDVLVRKNDAGHQAFLSRWRYRREFDLLELKKGEPAAGKVALAAGAQDVADALRRAPEAVEVLLAAADLERMLGQAALDDAAKPAEQREKAFQEHRDRAYEHLQHGLKLQENLPARAASDTARFQLWWHKASLLLDDVKRADGRRPGDPGVPDAGQVRAWEAEAARSVEQLRKTRLVPAAADFLQGRLLVHERRWAEAVALFEHARALLGPQTDLANQVNLHLGQCYEQLEEPSQMLAAYGRVAENDPASVVALVGMAAAEWSMQRLDSAFQKYQQLIASGRLPDRCWIDVARLEIQRQAQRETPRWEGVEGALKNAAKATPDAVEIPLLTAEMWVARGQESKAAEVLSAAKDKWPREAELWAAEADLALHTKHYARAGVLLDEGQKEVGDGVVLRLARARALAASLKKDGVTDKDKEEVRKGIDALAAGIDRFPEDQRGRLLSGLAYAQLQADNPAGARVWWQRMAELPAYRTDLRLRLLLFDLALKLNDVEGMDRALADVRAVEGGDGTFVQYGQALRLLWQAEKKQKERDDSIPELAEAQLLLDRVLAQRPNWPAVYLARARAHELEGNKEQAIKDLREAMHNGDTSPEVIRQLAYLLTDRGRHDEAAQEMSKVREQLLAQDPDLGRLAIRIALGQGKFEDAALRLNTAVKADTDNFKELVYKGWVLAEARKPAEAEQFFARAAELAPGEPVVWVARVQFLAGQKRTDDARKVIDEAAAKMPPEKKELTLAQCWESLGQEKEATLHYKAALAAQPEDVAVVRAVANFDLANGRVKEAEELLRQILDGKVQKASAGDRDWARHGLALVLASGTDYERFREALTLEGLQLDDNGQLVRERREGSSEQQKNKARVLATQLGQRQFRKRAIELLEGLDRSKSLLANDRYVLAVLYEADGNWRRSQEILKDLVETRKNSPQYLVRYVQSLLAHDQAEAEKEVQRLEDLEEQLKVEKNTYAAVEMRARLLEVQGHGDRALDLLNKHVRRPGADSTEILLVLDSLRRQKDFTRAYELCEKMWADGKCKPEVCGGVSVAVLRMTSVTDAQVQQLEARLRKAIADNRKSMVLRLHLADLYDLRGRYADAERLYVEVLQESNEPKNVVALNNLAWLLAHREGGAAEARKYIDAAVNGIGRRADLLDTRGLVYLKLGNREAALADFQEAVAEAPTPTRLYHLARAYNEARDKTRAAQTLEDARRLLGPSRKPLPSAMHPTEQEDCRRLLAELKLP